MKTLSFLLYLLPFLAAACTLEGQDAPGAAGTDLGKADGFAAPEFVVVRNQTDCITDPCPVFTAIDPAGGVSKIADVVLPDGEVDAREGLLASGLRVRGAIEVGSWEPGGTGAVLHVDRVVERIGRAAPFFNGIACVTFPCPSYTVVHEDGSHQQVASIDLSMHDLSLDATGDLHADLSEGRLLVGGFVRRGSWYPGSPGDTFVVTRFGVVNDDYNVRFDGVVCVTRPCPSYSGTDSAGQPHVFDNLNFEALELPGEEMSSLFERLEEGGVDVRGFASEVEIDVGENSATEYTLHVTRLLTRE